MKSSLKMMAAGLVLAMGLSSAAFAKDFDHGRRDDHRVENRDWNRNRDWRRDRDWDRNRDYRYNNGWYGGPAYRGPVYAPYAPPAQRGYYDAHGVFHYYRW